MLIEASIEFRFVSFLLMAEQLGIVRGVPKSARIIQIMLQSYKLNTDSSIKDGHQ